MTQSEKTLAQPHRKAVKEPRDRELEQAVTSAIEAMHDARLRTVFVKAHKGEVRLDGRVQTYHARQLVLQAAMSVRGVARVTDCLIVETQRDESG